MELSAVVLALPPPPPRSLDPVLDAAAACFARYGVRRTSVQDVAKAMGVNRTTVYRQAGNVEQLALLLAIRDAHRTLATLPGRIEAPRTVVDLIVAVVAEARAHPVLAKMLADERDLVGSMVTGDAPRRINRITEAIGPLLATAMRAGHIARRDPAILAEWLVRIGMSIILVEPAGGDEAFLAELLIPALTPSGQSAP